MQVAIKQQASNMSSAMEKSLSEWSLQPGYECYAKGKELYPQKPWKSVEKRMPVVAEYPTPGPDAMPMPFYIGTQNLNSAIIHRPAWTLHQRIERKPCYYQASPTSYFIRDLKSKGGKATAPAYTMRIKPQIKPLQELPGPASYKAKFRRILPKAPAFSFRRKPQESAIFKTPAPNEYSMPMVQGHHMTPPAHIMGHKLYAKEQISTPGPGAYCHEKFHMNLPSSPNFTIREKITEKQKMATPGPGSYCPERVIVDLPMAPRPTMGIKHSPYLGIWHPRIVGPRYC